MNIYACHAFVPAIKVRIICYLFIFDPPLEMIRRHLFSTAFAILILWLSFADPGTFSDINLPHIPYLDKVVHTCIYFTYTFILLIEYRHRLVSPIRYLVLSSFPFLFGLMIEILQSLLTNFRSGEILDVVVNTIGIGSAVVSWMILKKLFPKLS